MVHIRLQLFQTLESKLTPINQRVWESFSASSNVHKLNLLLGDHGYLINEEVGACFDELWKMFLVSGWAERRRLLQLHSLGMLSFHD